MAPNRLIFSLLCLAVSMRCMDGQTLPVPLGAVPFPASFTVSDNLVHITDPVPGIPGIQRLEPVFLPSGWQLLQVGGAWVLMNTNPPATTLQGLTTWLTMAQSALDPNTWCLGATPAIGPTAVKDVQPTLLDIWSKVTVPTGQIAAGQVNDAQVYMRVQKNPDPSLIGSDLTTAIPPIWSLNACGVGLPGVQFPPSWLQAGEVRTKVQVLVAY